MMRSHGVWLIVMKVLGDQGARQCGAHEILRGDAPLSELCWPLCGAMCCAG